jgi:hypothetical protein
MSSSYRNERRRRSVYSTVILDLQQGQQLPAARVSGSADSEPGTANRLLARRGRLPWRFRSRCSIRWEPGHHCVMQMLSIPVPAR